MRMSTVAFRQWQPHKSKSRAVSADEVNTNHPPRSGSPPPRRGGEANQPTNQRLPPWRPHGNDNATRRHRQPSTRPRSEYPSHSPPPPPPRRPAYGGAAEHDIDVWRDGSVIARLSRHGHRSAAEEQPSSYGRFAVAHHFVLLPGSIRLASTGAVVSPWRRRTPAFAGQGSLPAVSLLRWRLGGRRQVGARLRAPGRVQRHGRDRLRRSRGGRAPRSPRRRLPLLLEEDGAEEEEEEDASQPHDAFRRGYLGIQRQQQLHHQRAEAATAAMADRAPRGTVDERRRHVLRHARRGGAEQGDVHLRAARGGDGELRGGEPARARRVRVRAQGGARRRQGGGREAAQVRQRAGGARVPGGGGHHQPGAPPPPRLPRRLLHRQRAPRARLRVRPKQDPRVPPPWERLAGDAMADEAAHCARVGEGARLPARRLPSSDHPPRHQIRQHPPRQQLRSKGGGFRACEADVRQQHARVDTCDGDVRVPGAGVRVEREADGEVGRVLLRRDAAGARDGAAAHRRRRRRPLLLLHGGRQPRRVGAAGHGARPGRRRLRRRRRPEAGGQLRRGGDGARRRQRRRVRPPLGEEAPQDEPDREGAGGGHVAGGPERGDAAGAEHGVRHGGDRGQHQRDFRVVHVRHGPDHSGGDGGEAGSRSVLAGRRQWVFLRQDERGAEAASAPGEQVAASSELLGVPNFCWKCWI